MRRPVARKRARDLWWLPEDARRGFRMADALRLPRVRAQGSEGALWAGAAGQGQQAALAKRAAMTRPGVPVQGR